VIVARRSPAKQDCPSPLPPRTRCERLGWLLTALLLATALGAKRKSAVVDLLESTDLLGNESYDFARYRVRGVMAGTGDQPMDRCAAVRTIT
jgi:hypothetical protein